MYDELIKNLRGMAKGFCPFDIGNKMCGYFVTQEAADAIEKLDAIAQTYVETVHEIEDKRKWIPVAERLPEKYDRVLVYSKATRMGRSIDFINADGNWYTTPKVSHWMPLPQPPKDGES